MDIGLYNGDTTKINWIGNKRPDMFLHDIQDRFSKLFKVHLNDSGKDFGAIGVVLLPSSMLVIKLWGGRGGIEGMDGDDLLVYGNVGLEEYTEWRLQDCFSSQYYNLDMDNWFYWGEHHRRSQIGKIFDATVKRLLRQSVFWEPNDSFYESAGFVCGCQYKEWEEGGNETFLRQFNSTREILIVGKKDKTPYLAISKNNVLAYMSARKAVSGSCGSYMFLENDEKDLVVVERSRFMAEWHPDALYGDFRISLNPDFNYELVPGFG